MAPEGSKSVKKFIQSIKRQPVLWDTEADGYRSVNLKDKIWLKIAQEHGLAGACDAKARWKKLRDIHRDSLKRRRFKHMEPWKYSQQMAFLIPYMMNRKPENSVTLGLNKKHNDEDDDVIPVPNDTEPSNFVANDEDSTQTSDDTDPLKKFFECMCDSTRLLPEIYQLSIKKKIFEAVTEAEEHYIQVQMMNSDVMAVANEVEANFDQTSLKIKDEN